MGSWLIFWLSGWVRVRVTGRYPERFLNLALSQGLALWDVRQQEETVELCVGVRSYRGMRSLFKAASCHPHVLERHGLPFVLRETRQRWTLVLGGFLALAGVWVFSGFVWFVDVDGSDPMA